MDDLRAAMVELFQEANRSDAWSEDEGSRFPWYDSQWLSYFVDAQEYLTASRSPSLDEFLETTSILRIEPGSFRPVLTDQFFDEETMGLIRHEIASQSSSRLERDELITFGRDVVHDNPLFVELQEQAADRVGEIVGEEIEVSYNFLSLYGSDGTCPLHMDAPEAKWTLDICVDQSRPWPIHISEVVNWPVDWAAKTGQDWVQQVKEESRFDDYEMEPGQALLFGGSSQWHYRDHFQDAVDADHCTLLFFHFIPKGASDIVDYRQWPARFGLPQLSS